MPSVYVFEGYSLDAAAIELRAPTGSPVEASSTVVELVLFLVEHRARVVTKEELSARLWPDVVVNENALAQHMWAARKAVGDTGRAQRIIKNVRGRGYRWLIDVEERDSVPPERSLGTPPPQAGSGRVPKAAEFVGRSAELAWLSDLMREGATGHGRVALIAGDAGIGKTRLLRELRRVAEGEGFRDIEGRCHDDEGMPPFWPWKQALGELERGMADDALVRAVATEAADLSRLMPNLPRRVGEPKPGPAREADDDRYYLFQAVAEFLERAALEAPIVVTLDDLHWADLPSLQLLRFLGHHVGASRILVVGAYRGRELPPEHAKLLESTARNACVGKRTLEGLDLASITTLLGGEGGPGNRSIVQQIHSLTGGNPLFVGELGASPDTAAAVFDFTRSDGLGRIVARKIALLAAPCIAVARAASVLGQDFAFADLRRVVGILPAELTRHLDSLVEQRIVEPEPKQPGTLRFTHPLVREAVYAAIDGDERRDLHHAAAEVLEALPGGQAKARTDEIARHYLAAARAGTARKAADYARQAAERAFESAAFEESARLYRKGLEALELSEGDSERERGRLLLGLGHALRGALAPAELVLNPFAQVAQTASTLGDAALFAEAALGYAGDGPARLRPITEMGVVNSEELAYLTRASEMLGAGDAPEKALVLSLLARTSYHAADWQKRDGYARDAVSMARRLGDRRLLARTLLVKQQMLRTPHFLEERIGDLGETIEIARTIDAKELQIDARHERAWALLEAGRLEEADSDMHWIARLADELEQKAERRVVEAWELSLAYVRENVDEVEARDLARFLRRKTTHLGQAYGVRLFMARYIQDRMDETIPLLEDFARKFPLSGSWHCSLASTYASVGRLKEANRELEAIASAGYAAVPRTHEWLASFGFLANAAQLIGSKRRAAELRDVLAPFEKHVMVLGVGNFIGGLVSRTLGDLHRLLGDVEEAERCYAVALEIAERIRSPMLLAWIAVDQAELYLTSPARDPARAAALLGRALPLIEALGIGILRRRVRALAPGLDLTDGVPAPTRH